MFCIYLQQPAIDTLKETNPSGRFWIKLDGTDVKEALHHSAKDKWDVDVDLNDEKLVQLRQEYESGVELLSSTSLVSTDQENSTRVAEQLLTNFMSDCSFLETIFKSSSKECECRNSKSP